MPLPLTSLVLLLLVSVPAVLLWHLPRPRAVGLEQLLDDVSLLQSFAANPARPVPQLWRERLGPAAELLWRRQRGSWWQLWGDHADAAPMLAFSAATLPGGASGPLPSLGLRVGDLVVVAADPLSRQLLQTALRPQQRLSRGLPRRCLERLRSGQAVFWNQTGLGVISGPLAPLLVPLSQGCLTVELGQGGLLWRGEAGSGDALLARQPDPAGAPIRPLPPLATDQLLEVEGGSLGLLLQDLLRRPLIRDPLIRRYGFQARHLELVQRSPFRLRLRPQPQGPYQASLELQWPVDEGIEAWRQPLQQLARALLQQGLTPVADRPASSGSGSIAAGSAGSGSQPPPPSGSPSPQEAPARRRPVADASPADPSAALGSPAAATAQDPDRFSGDTTWARTDGVVVGGWRWIHPATSGNRSGQGPSGALSLDQRRSRTPQLLFFLGPVPATAPRPIFPRTAEQPGAGVLRLRSRPVALQNMGLLPPQVPELVRRSDQLWMEAQAPGRGAGPSISRLSGGLRVPR